MKRLIFDLETSLMTLTGFSLYEDYKTPDAILTDWHIISAAWKWEGEEDVYSAHTYTDKDKSVVKQLCEFIREADELVYHNGTKFDWKKLNTRVLLNGLPPIPKPKETDTLTQCKKHFAMSSNRLDYIGKALGLGGKVETSSGLWLRALKRDKTAIDEMVEYNKYDVILLEKVFKRLKPYVNLGYNQNIDSEEQVCNSCKSTHFECRGWSYTKTCRYQRFHCLDCNAWFQSTRKEPK